MRQRLVWLAASVWLVSLVTCNVVRARRGYNAESAPPPAAVVLRSANPAASARPRTDALSGVGTQPPAGPETTARNGSAAAFPYGATTAGAPATTGQPARDVQPDQAAPSPTASRPLANGASATAQGPTATPLASTRPNVFSTIRGNALRATGAALSRVVVRLRDVRFGRIMDAQMSDPSGQFTFERIDPGVYIAEIVGDNETVLATTEVLNVAAGDTVSTTVRLPFRAASLGGMLGDSPASAAIVFAEAAAAGVLTTTVTEPVSPTQ